MEMIYIADGKRFTTYLAAARHALRIAEENDTAVDIHVEKVTERRQVQRTWAATVYAGGLEKNSPHRTFGARQKAVS